MAGGRVGAAEGERIGALADLAALRLAGLSPADRRAVESVAPEDLRDFEAVLQAARYLMFKYDDRHEVRALMKDLVGIIERSTDGLGAIDDQISELVLSAEDSIRRIRDAQERMGVATLAGGRGYGAPPPSPPPMPPSPPPRRAAGGGPGAGRSGVNNLTTRSAIVDTGHYQHPCQLGDGAVE